MPSLFVIQGRNRGTRFEFRANQGAVSLGREAGNAVQGDDHEVSRRHAELTPDDGVWYIRDLESQNGTHVNGLRVNEAVLAPGDRVTLGVTVVRFEVQDALDQQYDDVLDRLLNVDELSGLFVRRKFDRELRALIDAARFDGAPVGLLVMDLDGVKAINDANGHLFGAYAIGESGRVIGTVLGDRGIASRFGGDEFVAAVPGADLARTEALGEEIRAAIAAHPFVRDGVTLHPGISVGVASLPESASDPDSLFRVADGALYRAKNAGKNRVSR